MAPRLLAKAMMRYGRVLYAVAIAGIFFVQQSAEAQNVYHVRAGATGANNGSDWANAFTSLPATLVRGATYYIADGNYPGYVCDDPVSASAVITIKKATASSHGSEVGWNPGYGDGQAIFTGQIDFTTSNWEFDGVTGGGPVNGWTSNFGFKITEVRDAEALIMVGRNSSANNITIRHVDLQGKGSVSTSGGGDSNDAIAIWGDSNVTLSYAYMHGIGRCPFFISPVNFLAEYVYVQSYFGSGGVHSEVASIWGFGGTIGDVTFRHCLITDIQSTGGIMWDNAKNPAAVCRVYGNVFYKPPGASWDAGNGLIGGWTGGNGEVCRNLLVYNNTFINVDQETLSSFPNVHSNDQAKNNLFYNCQRPSFTVFDTHDYNYFINSGGTAGEPNGTSGLANPFVDYLNLNFALVSNTVPGTDLGAPYNVDMMGRPRATWTRGAIEYVASGPDTTPPQISSVQVVNIATNGATITWSTSEPSTSDVDFGSTTSYGNTVTNSVLVMSHSVPITGLPGGSLYHFRVRSADAAGNRSQSADSTFTTLTPDFSAPTVSLTSPPASAIVSNTVTVSAIANDNIGVVSVEFMIGTATVSTDSTAPYSYNWDSRSVVNGQYPISVVARDAVGNRATNSALVTVQNTGPTLNDGLIGLWSFEEGSGNVVGDLSGGGNTGTVLNGAYWTPGKWRGGLGFDGVDDYVRVANSAPLELTNLVTLAAWVRPQLNGAWQSVIRKVVQEGTHAYPYTAYDLLLVDSAGTFQARMSVSGTDGNRVYVSGSSSLSYGTWYHLVGTYDGTNIRIYVNGVQDGIAAYSSPLLRTGQALYLGRNGGGGDLFKGVLDELRIYNRVLTSTQVRQLYDMYSVNPPAQPSGFEFDTTAAGN